ncbi:MAG: hypothetical protein IJI44_04015 [Erysipelotrichaceae bacterium]|nr:hypothetical protein [Erysipelotrichaceae bacterium]
MKKIRKIILAFMLLISIFGCTAVSEDVSTPSGAVVKYLKEVKKNLPQVMNSASAEIEIPDGFEGFFERIFKSAAQFDYEIINETIEDDQAEVTVKIKTYAFGNSLTNTFIDFVSQGETLLTAGASEEMLMNLLTQIWTEKVNDEIRKGKQYVSTVTIRLERNENEWLVISENEDDLELFNAISGNLYKLMLSYEE